MGLIPKDIEILPPYDDRIFKAMLTAPEAKPTLLMVSSAIIKQPVVNVIIRNNELPISDTNEKAERFDINCLIDDNSQVDIEMQSSRMEEEAGNDHGNLRARSVYNLCDLHSSQNSKGISYDKLIRSYQVMFCGYTVFPNRASFINTFSMRHETDKGILHDAIQSIFVELTKLNEVLKKSVAEMSDIEKFSVFLRYADNPDYREIVNRVIESKEGLVVAGEVLMNISQDEREKAIFRNRRIALADYESNMITAERRGRTEGRAEGKVEGREEGREEGRAEGRAEGREETIITVARNAIKMNIPIEDIIILTGLTRDELMKLYDSSQKV